VGHRTIQAQINNVHKQPQQDKIKPRNNNDALLDHPGIQVYDLYKNKFNDHYGELTVPGGSYTYSAFRTDLTFNRRETLALKLITDSSYNLSCNKKNYPKSCFGIENNSYS
jgi:hypothetical protein